jgi:hypothetical protein
VADQNISSDELEQNEDNQIAAQLKGELTDTKTGIPQAAGPPKPKAKTEAHIDLAKTGADDTIMIDRDGTFSQSEDPK